jgi:hypothetical protein
VLYIAARLALIVVPLTSFAARGHAACPTDTVHQLNRCLSFVRVALSRRSTEACRQAPRGAVGSASPFPASAARDSISA